MRLARFQMPVDRRHSPPNSTSPRLRLVFRQPGHFTLIQDFGRGGGRSGHGCVGDDIAPVRDGLNGGRPDRSPQRDPDRS